MAMKRKNLPEVVPELFEHEQFGQFRYIKRGEEIWFVAVDLCRALGYSNSRDALSKHVYKEDKRVILKSQIATLDTTLEIPNRGLTFINESGMYCLIFGSKLPAAKKFTRWVTNEVLPAIRKYGFYRVQQPEQEKVYVEITGDKYFKLFKEKYPEIDFNKALRRLGFTKIYDEHGYYHEEDVYMLRFYPDDYEKISRDPLSLCCMEKLTTSKNHRISQTTLQSKKIDA